MNYKVLDINLDYKKIETEASKTQPKMTLYLPDNSNEIQIDRKRPTVVICPGGAYQYTSAREAEPVALKFAASDCNAVVLDYSVTPAKFPVALLELSYTIATLRENAEEWNVDIDKICVMGFSAGGHLAASYGALWNKDLIREFFGYNNKENKPNGMILCYPVITSGEYAHRGSFNSILGDKADDPDMLNLLSVEKQVSEDTPPAFIWHTFNDACVPVENSLLLANALVKQKISTELHIFPQGHHGLSLANETVGIYNGNYSECQVWIDMAIRWLKNI